MSSRARQTLFIVLRIPDVLLNVTFFFTLLLSLKSSSQNCLEYKCQASSNPTFGNFCINNYLFVTSPFGISIQVQTGQCQQTIGSISTPAYPLDLVNNGNQLFVATGGSATNQIYIYDLATISSPTLLGAFPTGNQINKLTFANDHIYFRNNGYLYSLNVSSPASPYLVDSLPLTGSSEFSVSAINNHLWLIENNKLICIDINNPQNIFPIDTLSGNFTDYIAANNVTHQLLVSNSSGFSIIDANQPQQPSILYNSIGGNNNLNAAWGNNVIFQMGINATIDIYLKNGSTYNYICNKAIPNSGQVTPFNSLSCNDSIVFFSSINGCHVFKYNQDIISHTSNQNEKAFKAYPIPASDYLTFESDEDYTYLELIDIMGCVQKRIVNDMKTIYQIDLTDMENGTYFLKIVSKNGEIKTMKFLIQKFN